MASSFAPASYRPAGGMSIRPPAHRPPTLPSTHVASRGVFADDRAMSLMLSAEGLAKSYGPRTLFAGVGVSLFDGERVGLIGPNGSGKSTLLKIMAASRPPDEGEVVRRNEAVICYVPQEESFPPGLTVEQVVLDELERHHRELGHDHIEPHERTTQVAITLTRVGFADLRSRPMRSRAGGASGWRWRGSW